MVTRRDFAVGVGALGVSGFVPLFAAGERKPIWTAGIMTDTHVGRDRQSCELVRKACQLFAAHDVDIVVNCGDIADHHYPTAYPILKELTDAAFPHKPPRKIWVYANHDHIDRKDEPFATVMQDVKRLLGATNDLYDVVELAGYPLVVVPQDYDYPRQRRLLEDVSARYPKGPIFLFNHVPPFDTGDNTVTWGSQDLRDVLEDFPRVIVISGHAHGSLRSELNIWQGKFTAVNAGCLQVWDGHAVGCAPAGKREYGALIMEVYDDSVVFRRFDVRTQAEYAPNERWCVPLPFDPETAPYRRERTAKTEPVPRFPAEAKLVLASDAPFTKVELTFPRAESPHGTYCYRVQVLTPEGESLTRCDLFGQFYLSEDERTKTVVRNLSAGYFDPGRRYRIRVTPCNCFGVGGSPLEAEFVAPAAAPETTVVYEGHTPHLELGFFRYLKGTERRRPDTDGWFMMDRGDFRLEMPKGVWAGPAGARFRFTVDMETEQESLRTWTLVLRNPEPMRNANERIATPRGKSGRMRYVIEFAKPREDFDCYFLVREGEPGRIRFDHVRIERLDEPVDEKPLVRFGVVTDPHSGSLASTQPPHEVRAFRESPRKMREFVETMNARKVDFVVELGDFAECHPSRELTLAALDEIEREFARFEGPRYHVMGNHDFQGLTRADYLAHTSNTGEANGRTFYSFERGGVTFVVFDQGYYADDTPMVPGNTDWTKGHVSSEQWTWLEGVLAAAKGPVVTFSHWRLDPNGKGGLSAADADRMREVFKRSGKVIASFAGHHHYGDYMVLDGIGYYCLRAMCTGSGEEQSGYAEVEVYPSGKVRVRGYRKAASVRFGVQ